MFVVVHPVHCRPYIATSEHTFHLCTQRSSVCSEGKAILTRSILARESIGLCGPFYGDGPMLPLLLDILTLRINVCFVIREIIRFPKSICNRRACIRNGFSLLCTFIRFYLNPPFLLLAASHFYVLCFMYYVFMYFFCIFM